MSKDPFFQRESEKYESPVASREYILEYLTKLTTPASIDELFEALSARTQEQQEALRRRLRAMERDGQLVFTRRKRYALPERLDLVKGYVIGHRDGYGFLRVEGLPDDLYLSSEQMKMAIHGDLVLAQPLGNDRKGRREARIVRVLEPRTGHIVGRYFTDAGIGFVVPDDSRLHFDIIIPHEQTAQLRMGFVVVVALVQRPTRRTKAIGNIVEILGDNMGTNMAIDIAIRSHNIPHIWPNDVIQQSHQFSENVPKQATQGRIDLRQLPLVTIDGEDARDFDDAVYCQRKAGGGWRLWVAIADVSYYVRPSTALDNEAYNRGNSVYFPSQVIPMLPEVLSNGLCSLNPQVDRLCMVCEMTISAKGRLSSYKFYEAIMNSHARLTYNKVAAILKGDEALCQQYHALISHLQELHYLYQALDKARQIRGGIVFETEEPKFIFNAERRIERIEITSRNDAHKIIEECMILANISAARFLEKGHEPTLYRIHDKPKGENLTSLRSVLSELGLVLHGGNEPKPKDYAKLMDDIAERPDHEMLQTMLLRSMKQAVYDPENRGHFGLALSAYAHFTSPIRRYPDLIVHRGIKALLACQQDKNSNMHNQGAVHYSMQEVLQLGDHCSMTERRADEATRDVADWLKCDFMLDHVGGIFNGTITSITGFGLFVLLDDLFIDGLVHVSTLNNDYYRFDNVGQRLIGESSGYIYRLGDRVVIRVEGVHTDERKIDFSLVSTTRKPRRTGKTATSRGKNKSVSHKTIRHRLANSASSDVINTRDTTKSNKKRHAVTSKSKANKPKNRQSKKKK